MKRSKDTTTLIKRRNAQAGKYLDKAATIDRHYRCVVCGDWHRATDWWNLACEVELRLV